MAFDCQEIKELLTYLLTYVFTGSPDGNIATPEQTTKFPQNPWLSTPLIFWLLLARFHKTSLDCCGHIAAELVSITSHCTRDARHQYVLLVQSNGAAAVALVEWTGDICASLWQLRITTQCSAVRRAGALRGSTMRWLLPGSLSLAPVHLAARKPLLPGGPTSVAMLASNFKSHLGLPVQRRLAG